MFFAILLILQRGKKRESFCLAAESSFPAHSGIESAPGTLHTSSRISRPVVRTIKRCGASAPPLSPRLLAFFFSRFARYLPYMCLYPRPRLTVNLHFLARRKRTMSRIRVGISKAIGRSLKFIRMSRKAWSWTISASRTFRENFQYACEIWLCMFSFFMKGKQDEDSYPFALLRRWKNSSRRSCQSDRIKDFSSRSCRCAERAISFRDA